MVTALVSPKKSLKARLSLYVFLVFGAFLSAFAIDVFFLPNKLIDGGIVGIAMILSQIFSKKALPYFFILLNSPFVYLAYRHLGKSFVIHLFVAYLCFAGWLWVCHGYLQWQFHGDTLEVVVIGGAILGTGLGLIIRNGGCIDGTEILGVILNRKTGFTVGQVVFAFNIFIFGCAGLVFQDWHPPLLSLITYIVVVKIMDSVIVGLDETKSVLIISGKSKAIADAIMHELGLGLTIMYGRGGFSGDAREILYVIVERLQLADLKYIVHREDPSAFIAIENLHEVSTGHLTTHKHKKRKRLDHLFSQIFAK